MSESRSGYGAIVLLALITILIDICINTGDVVTDFWYGWELFEQRNEQGKESFFLYGIIVWTINWLPGVVATIYLLSMYRHKLGPKYALICSIVMLVLYPIVPIMTYIFILWTRPVMADTTVKSGSLKKGNHWKRSYSSDETTASDYSSDSDTKRRKTKKGGSTLRMESHKQFSDLAMLSYAICGGIESPLQFIFQVCNQSCILKISTLLGFQKSFLFQWWLIVNGKVPKPWNITGEFTFKDWSGNEVKFVTIALFSLVFSALSMLKAVIMINVINVHISEISICRKVLQFLLVVISHITYFISTAFFRIGTIILLMCYMNNFGFIPIIVFWMTNVAYGYIK